MLRFTPSTRGCRFSARVFYSVASAYERKTPREHVLLRPGMYVGAMEATELSTWLVEHSEKNGTTMVKKNIIYSPALLKIMDEILVNAVDNRHRDGSMSYIHIEVKSTKKQFHVTVENDGASIPIEKHPKENMFIPELIFGNLLTGSNFDDSKGSVVGGRHGYGAKLTNILSTSFKVEIYNHKTQQHYAQEWSDNMITVGEPVVTTRAGKRDFTRISFTPDLPRFNLNPKDEISIANITRLIERRAYDIAACVGPRVCVSYNKAVIAFGSFEDYMKLFSQSPDERVYYHRLGPRWEMGLLKSSVADHMSFVNALWTSRGGAHVQLILMQVLRYCEERVQEQLTKASTKRTSKPSPDRHSSTVIQSALRSKLFLFLNCLVENPSFDSQGKEGLTTKVQEFQSEAVIGKSFLAEFVAESGVIQEVLDELLAREQTQLIRATKVKGSRVLNIENLEDAHAVGSIECALIVTEGNSAKALAVAGLEVIGREKYGVLPLRGKILNVHEVTPTQLQKSESVMNLVRTLGLDFSKTYETGILPSSGLRYGRVILMTDQDTDGSHIKGLVINLLAQYWPHLLYNGFVHYIATPLVKVHKAADTKKKIKNMLSFYSLQEYDAWRKGQGEFATIAAGTGAASASTRAVTADEGEVIMGDYVVKYYKGLGTSTATEAREYFSDTKRSFKSFHAESAETTADAIDLAFSKKRAKDRRTWLETTYDASSYIDPRSDKISYEDFINKELIQYSTADNVRSLPNVIDGLKPSQRKVLFACFKRKLVDKEMKVVQLAGYVAEQTAYHHGETSLFNTIINMAQDFLGSNNVPLLEPRGQFGTRSAGGTDSASPRYIFTILSPIARLIFPASDDDQLTYIEEDGSTVEPEHFQPIIPMLLVNGSHGIGTGWSSFIPPHDIRDVIEHTKALVQGSEPAKKLLPSFYGFKGVVTELKSNFLSTGNIKRTSKTTVEITELPYGVWTAEYKKSVIQSLLEAGKIKDFHEEHTTDSVKFVVKVAAMELDEMEKEGLLRVFKLTSTMSTVNMHAFDASGKITRYSKAEDISAAHYTSRYEAYVRRKAALERKYGYEEFVARAKARFIGALLRGTLVLTRPSGGALSYAEMHNVLVAQGFQSLGEIKRMFLLAEEQTESADDDPSESVDKKHFPHLLTMPFQRLTAEGEAAVTKQAAESAAKLEDIKTQTVEAMWLRELDALREKADELFPVDRASRVLTADKSKKRRSKKAAIDELAVMKTKKKSKKSSKVTKE